MKKLFTLAAAAVLFGTGIVGCSNTAEGAKQDAATDTAAAQKATAEAADKTVKGTEKAVDATVKGAETATAVTEKAAADAANATKKAADNVVAGAEKTAAQAGEVATHTGKVLTVTPKVKAALLADNTVVPPNDPSASSINVDTDADGVTIHLKGTVPTNEAKKKATEVAQAAVKGDSTAYKISNELTVGKH